MHAGRRQQARDRRMRRVHAAVRQDEDAVARGHCLTGLAAQLRHGALEARTVVVRVVEQRQGGRAKRRARGQVAQLRDLVVVQDRVADGDLPAGLGIGLQQIPLGADGGAHRGDDLFADGVERRVGDLREELREVVVEQARPVGEHGQCRVGAHRADRLLAIAGHGREQHAQVLLRVAEGELALEHRLVIGPLGTRARQLLDVHQVLPQPGPVGVHRSKFALDFVVADDAALSGIHQEHLAGPQTIFGHHALGRDVEHTDLRRHDHEVVGGHGVARGPQAVAVEHCADQGAVGEGDRGRSIPRLHERRVVLVEVAHGRVHVGIAAPRLWNHHQHGVRQRSPGHDQELEHVVEGGGVAAARTDHRQELLQVVAEDARTQQAFAGLHPVDVAAQRVDLAVVRHHAVGMRQRPRREGVGGEALMHEGQGRGHARIQQIGEQPLDLGGREHALVDERGGRQAHDIKRRARGGVEVEAFDRVFDTLADHVERALEAPRRVIAHERRRAADEELLEDRGDSRGGAADGVEPDRHRPPAEHALSFLGHDAFDQRAERRARRLGGGQEDQAGAVGSGGWQREGGDLPQEPIGHLKQDAGAVAGVGIGASGAAVLQVNQQVECLPHDGMRAVALEVGHEPNAAGVVFVAGPIQPRLCVSTRARPRLVAGVLRHA